MIGRLNHVAIAVPDLAAAAALYRDRLGARVSEAVAQPDHGVTTVFVELPNTNYWLRLAMSHPSPGFLPAIRRAVCTTSVTRWRTSTPP